MPIFSKDMGRNLSVTWDLSKSGEHIAGHYGCPEDVTRTSKTSMVPVNMGQTGIQGASAPVPVAA